MSSRGSVFVTAVGTLVLSVSTAGQAPTPKTFDLRYRTPKNATFSVANTAQYASFGDADGRLTKRREMFAGMVLHYRVLSVDPSGEIRFEVTYRSRYRTYADANGVVTPVDFSNLIGGRFTYRLSPRGRVSQLEGFDTLNVRLGDGKDWSRDQLKSEIEHLLPQLPEHPVRIGDTWRGEVQEGGPGSPPVTIEYRLLGEARIDGVDCVRLVARYASDENRTTSEAGRTFAVAGRTVGNDVYYFAPKDGMLIARVSTGQTNTDVTEAGKATRRTHTEEMYETRITLR